MRVIDLIVVHCAATKPSMDVGVEEIRVWHKARKFTDIGYHLVIRRDGTLEKGREIEKMGAHAKGFNDYSIGVCLVGGLSERGKAQNNFTKDQFETLRGTLTTLAALYNDPDILGHRDLPGVSKACPCFDVVEWVDKNM